ncbi:uncharacterized protein LOC117694443 [Arvicanthis niloticus]|uniref:uncharacterized protein LOC117694443 n=1 Tax=Arvicanthis niloticus TaxID=61156 RepID=UPI00403D3F63
MKLASRWMDGLESMMIGRKDSRFPQRSLIGKTISNGIASSFSNSVPGRKDSRFPQRSLIGKTISNGIASSFSNSVPGHVQVPQIAASRCSIFPAGSSLPRKT